MNYDSEYNFIVYDILNSEEFDKIRYIEHHGITRFDHSVRVSYLSYKIAKNLKFKYREVARAGLLHDFFMSDFDRSKKEKFLSTFTHPKKALKKSVNNFKLNKREKNIILSHMFPLYISLPRYKESVLVSIVDKIVAFYEFSLKFRCKFKYITNVYILVLFGVFK